LGNISRYVPIGYFLGNILNSICMLLIIPTFAMYIGRYEFLGNGFIIGQLCALVAGYSFALYLPRLFKGVVTEEVKVQVTSYMFAVLTIFISLSLIMYKGGNLASTDSTLLIFPIILLMSQNLILQWFHIYLRIAHYQVVLFILGRLAAITLCLCQLFDVLYLSSDNLIYLLLCLFYLPVIPSLKNFNLKALLQPYKIKPLLKGGASIFKMSLLSSIYLIMPAILISYINTGELAQFQQFDRIRLMIGNFVGVILGIIYSYQTAGSNKFDVQKHIKRISVYASLSFIVISTLITFFTYFSLINKILEVILLDITTLILALFASFVGSTTNIFVTLGIVANAKEGVYFIDLFKSIAIFILLICVMIMFKWVNKLNFMVLICFVELLLFTKVYKRISNLKL
jgi:hypothetical protein